VIAAASDRPPALAASARSAATIRHLRIMARPRLAPSHHGQPLHTHHTPKTPRLPYNPFASSYKNVYKAPSIAFSALRVDPSRVDSCDKSQPYAQRAEMKPLDQRPGSTLSSAARTASTPSPPEYPGETSRQSMKRMSEPLVG
jgi:hypothetical protein